jgi:gliding motility-associated-like protein
MWKMKHLLPVIFLFIVSPSLTAKHIIGSVISYECLGGGTYKFTMKMYRDCSDPTGAGFDNPANFAVYKGNSQTPLGTVPAFMIDLPINIDPDIDNPCLVLPPNTCVQEGIYEFEYTFSEWPSNDSYHLTFQRCCRNATVTNIQTPGDVGATFTIELTPASQALCNNSPVFETFPPIIICAGIPFEYDHAAFDPEGDQLIYELCEPLIGAGRDGLGGVPPTPGFPCDDLIPFPACPPPYETVQYVPPYTAINPMGGDPQVTIDPVTGLLYGTPNTLGQFSVGVCVYEYRNGELMSIIRRDFQFNIADCQPLVEADMISDEISNDEYLFERCEGLDVFIDNQSSQMINIDNYRWDFLINGQIESYFDWSPTITFPTTGTYTGQLILNPETICGDTADISITLFPEIVSNFEFDYDTCVAGPVAFVDDSFIDGPGEIIRRKWQFGDGDTSANLNPVHIFEEPGNYFSGLIVTDSNGCENSIIKQVNYRPVPAVLVVSPNDTLSCPPAEVTFNNLSNPIDNSYDIFWDFGDGNTSTALNPTHIYETEGIFTVSLEIVSPIGCITDTIFENLIEIVPPPIADFYCEPDILSNLQPFSGFFDQSIDAAHWEWHVDDQIIAHTRNVDNYEFRDTGLHEITLYITHAQKCQDTITKIVDVVPKWFFHMPNAFSPNEDTTNDLFKGKGLIPGISRFRMQIWDRWGQMVFETTDPYEGWNGKINQTGKDAAEGVYVVLVSFNGPRGTPYLHKGFATLMR